MDDLMKNATRLAGLSGVETVLLDSENIKDSTTVKPPTKAEACLAAFESLGSLNTFEANTAYSDTCLHSCVSSLNRKYGVIFNRRSETVLNRVGKRVTVKRYSPTDVGHMKQVLTGLREARGVEL
jgi:hypothetical protein